VTYVQGVIRSLSSSRSTQAERTLRLQPGILGIGVPLLHLSANAASDTLVTVDTLLVLLLLLLQGIMGRVHTARVGHLMESEREGEERDRKGEREQSFTLYDVIWRLRSGQVRMNPSTFSPQSVCVTREREVKRRNGGCFVPSLKYFLGQLSSCL
jgi:hypothetical protein